MSNRVAFVTGASRGIGRCIALTLSKEGFDIIVASPEVDNNEKVAGEIRAAGGQATTLKFDVSSPEGVKDGIGAIVKDKGRIDVLINNAGIARDGIAMRMKQRAWDLERKINTTGAVNCPQHVQT